MAIEEDDLSLPEGNEIIETNDIHEEEVEVNNIFYEISFKCNTDIFKSKLIYNVGEMVIVHCERGYNVGFVIREVPQYEIHDRAERTHFKPKKIHSRVTENIDNVRDMLKSKIEVENFALTQCRAHMRGHRLGAFAEALATEFQFDHKKLIVYLKKYEEVSVCRLVRKLYDKFKTRIKVIEVESLEELHKKSMIYIEISKLDITLSHIFEAIQEENSSKYLLSKYQQLNSSTIYSTQVTATGDENSAANIFYEYQNYRPSNRVKTQLLMNQKNNTDQLALYNDAIDYGLGKSFLHNPPSPPEIDITFDDNNTQFINYNQMYDSITSKKNYNHSTYQPPLTNNIPLVPSSSSSTTTKTKSISPLSFHNNHNNNNNNYTNHHNNHQQSYNNNNNNRYKSSIPLRQNYTSSSQYYNHQQQHTTNKYHQNNHYEQSYHDYIDNDINPHFRVTQVDEFERQYSYPHYVIEHK